VAGRPVAAGGRERSHAPADPGGARGRRRHLAGRPHRRQRRRPLRRAAAAGRDHGGRLAPRRVRPRRADRSAERGPVHPADRLELTREGSGGVSAAPRHGSPGARRGARRGDGRRPGRARSGRPRHGRGRRQPRSRASRHPPVAERGGDRRGAGGSTGRRRLRLYGALVRSAQMAVASSPSSSRRSST